MSGEVVTNQEISLIKETTDLLNKGLKIVNEDINAPTNPHHSSEEAQQNENTEGDQQSAEVDTFGDDTKEISDISFYALNSSTSPMHGASTSSSSNASSTNMNQSTTPIQNASTLSSSNASSTINISSNASSSSNTSSTSNISLNASSTSNISSNASSNNSLTNDKGVLITSLLEKHKDRLCGLLDMRNTSNVPHWHHVIEEFLPAGDERDILVADLYRCQHGGGNPPLVFLEVLISRNGETTKKDFREKSKLSCIERYDIANHELLKDKENSGTNRNPNPDSGNLLRDLTLDQKKTLASLLTKRPGINGWKHYADEYKFSNASKNTIAVQINAANTTKPTEKLLDFMITKKKTTVDLKDACKHLENVVEAIREIEKYFLKAPKETAV